ncbi:restriction endonuclease S subunit [Mycoplasmoides fastidiosum]|uniref:Restriction endonuclease S subunit n=1 Tax=Mycoplasmoides fastidiosum TaxID=92758 RepID=A0ABU0M097_9BACT|nr:restriction endonuclease S subunit [Mycoplasmoides fastidiosum]
MKEGQSQFFIDADSISKNNIKKFENQLGSFAPKNSILFVKDGSVGLMKFIDFDCWIGSTLFSFSNSSVITTKFIYFYFLAIKKKILSLKKGSVVSHIYFKDLEKLEINMPNEKTQEKIINIIEHKINS